LNGELPWEAPLRKKFQEGTRISKKEEMIGSCLSGKSKRWKRAVLEERDGVKKVVKTLEKKKFDGAK